MHFVKIRLTEEQKAALGVSDDGLDAAFLEFPDAVVEKIDRTFGVRIYMGAAPWTGTGTASGGTGASGSGPGGTGPSGSGPGGTGPGGTGPGGTGPGGTGPGGTGPGGTGPGGTGPEGTGPGGTGAGGTGPGGTGPGGTGPGGTGPGGTGPVTTAPPTTAPPTTVPPTTAPPTTAPPTTAPPTTAPPTTRPPTGGNDMCCDGHWFGPGYICTDTYHGSTYTEPCMDYENKPGCIPITGLCSYSGGVYNNAHCPDGYKYNTASNNCYK
jgi:hypothetical protein